MVKMSYSHTQRERERNRQTEEENKVTITIIVYKATQMKQFSFFLSKSYKHINTRVILTVILPLPRTVWNAQGSNYQVSSTETLQ